MSPPANFFSLLGVRAERGRTFVPAEDSGRRAHPVVVLSHAGWKKHFGADPNVVGTAIVLNGESYTVRVPGASLVDAVTLVGPAGLVHLSLWKV